MTKPKEWTLSEKMVRNAERCLCKSDSVMARLIHTLGPCSLARRKFRPFHTLAISIISQQLSAKASATIVRRVSEFVPTPFHHNDFLQVSKTSLRKAGLSRAKANYLLELSQRVSKGLLRFKDLKFKNDEAVIEILTALPGIGRWTAEMFLIFGLKRPDILALGDAGLQRAAGLLYGVNGDSDFLARVGRAWIPYRSIASWYLWRRLDIVSRASSKKGSHRSTAWGPCSSPLDRKAYLDTHCGHPQKNTI